MNYNTISFALGVLGSVLGVVNFWRSISKDKVKLRVIPKRSFVHGDSNFSDLNVGIEVINLSLFPVTLDNVGFKLRDTDDRACILKPITLNGESLPFRLESRAAITCYGHLPVAKKASVTKAYAKTSCGEEFIGTSPALRQFLESS